MIDSLVKYSRFRVWGLSLLLVLAGLVSFAKDGDFPDKPSPPRLVNDYAGMLSTSEESRLERMLEDFARTTSTQITVVTIKNLGGYDVSDYSFKLFNKWGIGQAGKNNGVLLMVSLEDRKAFIAPGKGLEGVLTDAKSARIFRNELRPAFKSGDYYGGIEKTADAIIAVTKDEYTADKDTGGGGIPAKAIIVIIIFIVMIIRMMGRGGGGGRGGGYMSGRGLSDVATGMLLGNMLGGGRGGGGWGDSGGGGFGGGGFGGFGGGSSGGGGAGGSW
jgi:uncharacterized protein